ncbi:MAG: DegT/DnrJ/EryC1/StrS family aminotransferase [Puniceicoccales bacterium]|jgi:dTDP-4-amino-4,6-dideoxygalactose transaminase|nr:DegT/DnrJ/EryC1/StrS family aminotransferase [Puniceicoccales bacterium]
MKVPLLDLQIQNEKIRSEIIEKFSSVFDSGEFILGKEVEAFEKNAAQYLGTKHAIGVSSGTDAILVSLMAIGIGAGDEVICPSFTFFATAGCIARLGAKPVFADINLEDFNISTGDIRKKITKRTKAILPVHLFGQTADMSSVVKIAEEFDLAVIEDCAQSFGSKHGGKQSGTFGLAGCFSFFPSKNLGGFGDSGLVCTDDDSLAEKIRILRVHGAKPRYFHRYIGGNFRIDELQAALLNIKLPHVDGYIRNRRHNAEIYAEELKNVPQLILPQEIEGNFHTWNQFTVRILDGVRDEVFQTIGSSGIGCNIYYPLPLDAQECFRQFTDPKNPTFNAAIASKEVLSLPIYPELHPDQILRAVKVLTNALPRR